MGRTTLDGGERWVTADGLGIYTTAVEGRPGYGYATVWSRFPFRRPMRETKCVMRYRLMLVRMMCGRMDVRLEGSCRREHGGGGGGSSDGGDGSLSMPCVDDWEAPACVCLLAFARMQEAPSRNL